MYVRTLALNVAGGSTVVCAFQECCVLCCYSLLTVRVTSVLILSVRRKCYDSSCSIVILLKCYQKSDSLCNCKLPGVFFSARGFQPNLYEEKH
jgi:hypothetical protein